MPATSSTPGMRAKWRTQRLINQGKIPNPEDLALMRAEGIEIPQSRENQDSQSSQSPLPPLVHTLRAQKEEIKRGTREPDLSDIVPPDRKLTKTEKEWHDYFSNRFGPFVLLIIWFMTANLEKATFYAPSPDEMRSVAVPLAKWATKLENWLHVPSWVHDTATSSDDALTIAMGVMAYLDRIGFLEKIIPYYTGLASRMRARSDEDNEQVAGSNGQIFQNGRVPGNWGWQHAAEL